MVCEFAKCLVTLSYQSHRCKSPSVTRHLAKSQTLPGLQATMKHPQLQQSSRLSAPDRKREKTPKPSRPCKSPVSLIAQLGPISGPASHPRLQELSQLTAKGPVLLGATAGVRHAVEEATTQSPVLPVIMFPHIVINQFKIIHCWRAPPHPP